jgi:RIO-like serine/threonine protein kinase
MIGPYRIVRVLGTGGWSTVYEVQAPDGSVLALKRLRDDLPAASAKRFEREIDSLRRIEHPGVLRVVDAGVDRGVRYLVTPKLDGRSVRELGPLGVEGALVVVAAAADAVGAIHAAGLIHRDLKPENLMVTAAGQVVVIDLGLALGPDHSRHTEENTVTGSVPYMAPEQIEDRVPSPASDVWALCVVLYEAAAGRRPFQRARGSEEVAAILAGVHDSLASIDPRCADEVSAIIERGLEASPARRPGDGRALAGELFAACDWPIGDLRAEIAKLVAAPSAYAASVALPRARSRAAAARAALARGDRFAASRHLDRGLACMPRDAELLSLVDVAMSGPAVAPEPRTSVSDDLGATIVDMPRPKRRRWPIAVAAIVAIAVSVALWLGTRPPAPAPETPPVTTAPPAAHPVTTAIAPDPPPDQSPPDEPPPDPLPATGEVTRKSHVAPSVGDLPVVHDKAPLAGSAAPVTKPSSVKPSRPAAP